MLFLKIQVALELMPMRSLEIREKIFLWLIPVTFVLHDLHGGIDLI